MDARERVFTALDHEQPDRIPIDCWTTKAIDEKLLRHFKLTDREELLQKFDVDFRYVEGPKYVGPEPTVHADGSVEDHWGVPRVLVEDEGETVLRAGDVAAWPKGVRNAHHLQNRSAADCTLLAVSAGDAARDWGEYPDIDLKFSGDLYLHKDGTPYPPKD